MIIAAPQPVHAIVAGAPKIIGVVASAPPVIQRTFTGKGAPSATTLPAGNGKYNGIGTGWIVGASLSAPGAGYNPGDLLTENAGGVGSPLQVTLDAVDANGGIIDWHYTQVGNYTTYPAATAAFSGGTGNGAIFNLALPLPDYYIDNTNAASPVLYVCTIAGSNGSSTWQKISGGGGGGYMGEWNSGTQYAAGQFVRVTIGNTMGLFALPVGSAPPPAGTAPAFPEVAGNPWQCIGLPFQIIGVCSNGQKTIYVQATLPF